MNVLNLWEAWPVRGPWHLSPFLGGKNNRVWLGEAADGQCTLVGECERTYLNLVMYND